MKSGDLNHRIEFYKLVDIPVTGGGVDVSEELYLATSAQVEPTKQSRQDLGAQSVLIGDYKIITRYRRDKYPTKTMLIKYRGLTMTIASIQQYQEDREMLLIYAVCQ